MSMVGKGTGMVLALAAALLGMPQRAAAHCDSMDGPVVKAAMRALETGDVTGVLVWIQPADEAEIRDAFQRTLRVRALDATAREMADRWFFETVVRVHRAGEGEPFTGLKAAGAAQGTGIDMADVALERGSVDQLARAASEHLAAAIRERFERVHQLSRYREGDVEAGRRFVAAYVEYIHFVEAAVGLIHGAAHAH